MSQHLIKEVQMLKQEVALLKERPEGMSRYGTEMGQFDIGKVVDNHDQRIKKIEEIVTKLMHQDTQDW
jgi:hypothetical protein